LYQKALAISEKVSGPDSTDTAATLASLGGLYDHMGQFAKAEPLELRALRIYEKALGPEHPLTATAAGNLGRLYCDKGEFAKAEPVSQRAAGIRANLKQNRPAETN